jgi:hypothetical protein
MNRRIKEKLAVRQVLRAKFIMLGDTHAPQVDRTIRKIHLAVARGVKKGKITVARTIGDVYDSGRPWQQ